MLLYPAGWLQDDSLYFFIGSLIGRPPFPFKGAFIPTFFILVRGVLITISTAEFILSAGSGFHLAFTAINRSACLRLKRHSDSFSTLRTGYREHLPVYIGIPIFTRIFGAIGFSSPTASGTVCRIVGISLETAELLSFNRESEVLFTIAAIKYFFCETH